MAAAEYWPAGQFVQPVSAVALQAADVLVPAAHRRQAEHVVALAADQLTPAVQLLHTASAVAEQAEARNLPAAQTLEEQLEHGA